MGKTTNLNIRVDEELKGDAEEIFHELGLSMSSAINIFLRHCVRYGGIPFEFRIGNPNAETLAAIDDVNNNRNMSKAYDRVIELMEDLTADEDAARVSSNREDIVHSLTGILPGDAALEMAPGERLRKNGSFDEEILADLIASGFSGEQLLNEFKAVRRQIRPAAEALLDEARLAAQGKIEACSHDELIDQDDPKRD